MIRYEIYSKQETVETDHVIRIKLTKDGNEIRVEAVDENGRRYSQGSLIGFRADGTIRRYGNIDSSIGLKLDRDQQIVIE